MKDKTKKTHKHQSFYVHECACEHVNDNILKQTILGDMPD